MNQDQRRLVEALKIRQAQISAQAQDEPVKYPLHLMHHARDVQTVIAVLEGKPDAVELLKNMPTEKDLPPQQ